MSLPDSLSAPPLTVGGKLGSRVIQSFGIRGIVGAAVGAGFGQALGTPYEWGGGMEGFGKRYASNFGGNLARQTFSFALESALHEDPRFFPSSSPLFKNRLFNSVKQVFLSKTDSGHTSFAYGKVISAFAAGQLINTWQPASNGKVSDGLERGVISLGGDLSYYLLQEFFPFTRSKHFRHQP